MKYLIKAINNNSDDYDKKYNRVRSNSDDANVQCNNHS